MLINDSTAKVAGKTALANQAVQAKNIIFSRGEIVHGTVLKNLGAGQVMVNVNGAKLVATAPKGFEAGEKFIGKVESPGPPLRLSILGQNETKEAKSLALLRELMPSKGDIGKSIEKIFSAAKSPDLPPAAKELLENLTAALKKNLPEGLAGLTPEKAKSVLKNSGIHLEANLAEAIKSGDKQAIRKIISTDLKATLGKSAVAVEKVIIKIASEIEQGSADNKLSPSKSSPAPATGKVALKNVADFPGAENAKTDAVALRENKSFPPEPARVKIPVEKKGFTRQKARSVAPDATQQKLVELSVLKDISKDIRKAVSNIELSQISQVVARKGGSIPSTTLFHQIPFLEGEQVRSVSIHIDPEQEGEGSARKKKSGERTIVFMLEMSALGQVRIDVRTYKTKAIGTIYAGSDRAEKAFAKGLNDLRAAFSVAGINATFDLKRATKDFLTEPVEKNSVVLPKGLVDITA